MAPLFAEGSVRFGDYELGDLCPIMVLHAR
jgi:hypothetical protein